MFTLYFLSKNINNSYKKIYHYICGCVLFSHHVAWAALELHPAPLVLKLTCASSTHRRGLNPPHRVKSISMTTFTHQEIEFLQKHSNEVSGTVHTLRQESAPYFTFSFKSHGFDSEDSWHFSEPCIVNFIAPPPPFSSHFSSSPPPSLYFLSPLSATTPTPILSLPPTLLIPLPPL